MPGRKIGVAILIALSALTLSPLGPRGAVQPRQASANHLPAASGARIGPLNADFSSGLDHWIATGEVILQGGAGGNDDPSEGNYSNSDTTCTGSKAGNHAHAAELSEPGAAIVSDVFTVPDLPLTQLSFVFSAPLLDPTIEVNLYLESESFSTAHRLFESTFDGEEQFRTTCDVSHWAGENVKIEFKNASDPMLPEPWIFVLNAGLQTSVLGSTVRFPDNSDDPVSLVTGHLTHSHTDIAIPGRGGGLTFTRNYHSARATIASELGYGWSHNYALRLDILDDGSVEVVSPSGARTFFALDNGGFVTPPGAFETLELESGVYTLATPSRTRFTFDSTGRLTAIIDRNGNATSVTYDATTGFLDAVTDAAGRSLQFTFDEQTGHIAEIADPLGRTVGYEYDEETGDLTEVTDAKGGVSSFGYTNHLLATITNARNDLQVTNTYDTASRVVEQEDAAGGITCFYYGTGPTHTSASCPGPSSTPSAGETILVDPRGSEELHQFDSGGRPTAVQRIVGPEEISVQYAYENGSSSCTIDENGDPLPVNNGNLCSITDPLGSVTEYTYDLRGNVRMVTDPLGHVWETRYASTNEPDVLIDPRSNETNYDHDSRGNITAIVDALSNTTTLDWETSALDSCSGPTAADRGMLCSITDPLAHSTSFSYDEYGNVLSIEDELGNVTSYTYDLGGRVLTATKASRQPAAGGESGAACGSAGTGDGVDDDADTVIDDGCPSSIFEYDNQNNVTKVIEAFTGGSVPITQYEYDAVGNLTGVRRADRQAVGAAESEGDCDAATGTGDGQDDDGDTVVDDGCLSMAYEYDEKNRLTAVIQARITGQATTRKTTYVYDENDNLTELTDPRHQGTGRPTVYTYDDANRLTRIEYPDVHYVTEFTYDAAGRRLSMTDTRGACEAGYAPNCSVGTSVSDTTEYAYDAAGRLQSVETSFAGVSRTVEYGYDAANNRTLIRYPDLRTATYTYDELNRMETVTASWISGETEYLYDAAGRLDAAILPSSTDISIDYAYDDANRLVGIDNIRAGTPPITLSSIDYELDANGNRIERTDSEGVTTYEYDELDRLVSVTYPGASAIDYAYDLVGNRLSVSSPMTTYTYDEVDQLTAINGVANLHDRNGNLRVIGASPASNDKFLHDLENRLFRHGPCGGDVNADGVANSADLGLIASHFGTEGTNAYDVIFDLDSNGAVGASDLGLTESRLCRNSGANTGNARNWYNGDGLRVRQRTFFTSPSRVDNDYVWDVGAGLPVILQDIRTPSGGSATTTTYLYGLGRIAETDGAGDTYFYLSDGLGSTTELTDDAGAVTDTYLYDVWGAVRGRTGATANDFTFTGEQQDARAQRGLVYLRARHYDPALGRFLGRDPVEGGSPYGYALANPSNVSDPSGLCVFGWPCVDDVAECIGNKLDCTDPRRLEDIAIDALPERTVFSIGGRFHVSLQLLVTCTVQYPDSCPAVFAAAVTARAMTLLLYGPREAEREGFIGGPPKEGDAFEHCFWSGLSTLAIGAERAETILTRYEARPNNFDEFKEYDLQNNARGRAFASNNRLLGMAGLLGYCR